MNPPSLDIMTDLTARGPAYWIVNCQIHDMGRFRRFSSAQEDALARYGGDLLHRVYEIDKDHPNTGTGDFIVRFENLTVARECRASTEFRAARRLFESCATIKMVITTKLPE